MRCQQPHRAVHQLGLVALNIQNIQHFLAVGKAGRVEHNQVELLALLRGFVQILEHVGADNAVRGQIHAVQLEITLGPIQISIRQINGFATDGAARGRIHREAARVGKQVQETLARRRVAHFFARIAVVEKQAGIEIFVEIDPKPAAVFADDEIFACRAGFFVLRRAFLAGALFQMNVLRGKSGNELHGFAHIGQPLAVFFGVHQPAGIVFLQMDVLAVHIDGERKLGNVFIVNAPCFQPVPLRPFELVLDVFAEPVGKIVDCVHKWSML